MPENIGVVVTTYNSPGWLEKVFWGYEYQTDVNFKLLVADDGSSSETLELINRVRAQGRLNVEHYWQEDKGFRKTVILNKVVAQTDCDYLIFTDGDCIPRADFIAVHRHYAAENQFLSGGYIKLTMPVSESVNRNDLEGQHIFEKQELTKRGQPANLKLWKLVKNPVVKAAMNALTPTKATWNGMNSSAWAADIKAVNGFDERMQYGGLDRELGERLWNKGLVSKQIRYSAVCLHLDHPRGYSKPEIWAFNDALRKKVREEKLSWTEHGIEKN